MNFDQFSVHELAAFIVSTDDLPSSQACFERLAEKIRKQVRYRAFAQGCPAQDLDDFESELSLKLWESLRKKSFDPGKGTFWTWFATFLQSRFIDFWRRGRHRLPTLQITDPVEAVDSSENTSAVSPQNSQHSSSTFDAATKHESQSLLPPCDLQQLETWQTRDRVLVLARIGWLSRVPPDVWQRWLVELGANELGANGISANDQGIATPFPLDVEQIFDWLESLLRLSRNGLAQRWGRQQERLVELVSFWVVLHDQNEPWTAVEQAAQLNQAPWPCLVILVVARTWKRLDGPPTWAGVQQAVDKKFRVPVLSYERVTSVADRLQRLNELAMDRLRPTPSESAEEVWNRSQEPSRSLSTGRRKA